MKKYQAPLSLIFILSILNLSHVISQDCDYPTTNKNLIGNDVKGAITNSGHLFQDISNLFIYDDGFGSSDLINDNLYINTITSNQLIIAAKDSLDNLKLAGSFAYSIPDFSPGPILNQNGTLNYQCEDFDKLWEVFGSDIFQHISDFNDNGIIDNPNQNIYAYPGHQNPYFENIHGFNLPNTPEGLAPFYDMNNDGVYNPDMGDYPLPDAADKDMIPTHLIWGIFNDGGGDQFGTGGDPLFVEVQLTAWNFFCPENEVLNNTLFTSHKLINRGNQDLDSLVVGFANDFEMGCGADDYIGSIPNMNTIYGYNSDELDGTTGCTCLGGLPTYCDVPPAQSITFLNQSMNSAMYYEESLFTTDFEGPENPEQFYNFLNAKWKDGTPLTQGGNGQSGIQPTSFVFPDNPNDSLGWSAYTSDISYVNGIVSIGSVALGEFNKNQVYTIDMAYTYFRDTSMNHLEIVDKMYSQIPDLQQSYDQEFENNCSISNICLEDCIYAGDADKDSIVTNCDILQVGLAFGQSGSDRNSPSIWFPYSGENWNNSFNGIDVKHADCTANGSIDLSDFKPININYGNSYKVGADYPDVYTYGEELSFEVESSSNPNLVKVDVKLNQQEEIYGLAFTIEYDTSFLDFFFSSVNLIDIWESANNSNTFSYEKEKHEIGEIDYASVRLDNQNSLTKSGIIEKLTFQKLPTSYELVETLIRIKNIKAILNDGTELDYGSKDLIVEITNPDGTGIILSNDDLEKEHVKIFPNPTSDAINVQFESPQKSRVTISDSYGKILLQKSSNEESNLKIDTNHFSNGIYFLRVQYDNKIITQKFIKI